MKLLWCLVSFSLSYYLVETVQPYFPSQVVFSPDNGQTIIAIDEINQRAYKNVAFNSTSRQTSFLMEHFPYAVPDSPQSKYYVQLLIDSSTASCKYGTYWKYGTNNFNINTFPYYWVYNSNSVKVGNYFDFGDEMIYSNASSVDEDYWYSNRTCEPESRAIFPCEQVYFKKNTEIPLRLTQIFRRGWELIEITTNYTILSMGKPDEKFFDSIPKNWNSACQDVNLGVLYYPQIAKIDLNQPSQIHISLSAPPHRINGNDTVIMQWKATGCNDCVTWTPKELTFNIKNFQEEKLLRITRVKDGPQTTLIPIFYGGGFDLVPTEFYSINIQ